MAWAQLYHNEFTGVGEDPGLADLTQDVGGGTIAQSGGNVRLGGSTHWWPSHSSYDRAVAYKLLATLRNPWTIPARFECGIVDGIGAGYPEADGGVLLWSSNSLFWRAGHNLYSSTPYAHGARWGGPTGCCLLDPTSGMPGTGASRFLMRLYWVPSAFGGSWTFSDFGGFALGANQIRAYWSDDNGSSWTHLDNVTDTLSWTPTRFGVFFAGGGASCYVDIDYLNVSTDLDLSSPVLSNQDPTPNESGVSTTKILEWDVTDPDSGVVLSTVRVYVDEGDGESLVYDGSTDTWSTPYAGPSSAQSVIADGYHFALQVSRATGSWVPLSTVTVRVVAENTHGIELDESYSFTIDGPDATAANEVGFDLLCDSDGDVIANDSGRLRRDSTIASRARRRLLIRKGQWVGDVELGSELHLIRTVSEARRRIEAVAIEALQPLIDDGSVSKIVVSEPVTDDQRGYVYVEIDLQLPAGEIVPLGHYRVGT